MSFIVQGHHEPMSADLTALIEKRRQLELSLELVSQSNQCLIIFALAAEHARRGSLTCEDVSSIRASVRAIDQNYLDSLEIDLERVNAHIASLTPAAATQH